MWGSFRYRRSINGMSASNWNFEHVYGLLASTGILAPPREHAKCPTNFSGSWNLFGQSSEGLPALRLFLNRGRRLDYTRDGAALCTGKGISMAMTRDMVYDGVRGVQFPVKCY